MFKAKGFGGPRQRPPSLTKKPAIFDSADSDDDNEPAPSRLRGPAGPGGESPADSSPRVAAAGVKTQGVVNDVGQNKARVQLVNKELQIHQTSKDLEAERLKAQALAEDPSVYEYDGVWDELKQHQDTQKALKKGGSEKKSKYIGSLLAAAEKRKLETLRVSERKVQKERDEEGLEFADKEKFVTEAYKVQLEQVRLMEAEEKRQEQGATRSDLTGFYRTMLNQTARSVPLPKLNPKGSQTMTSSQPSASLDAAAQASLVHVSAANLNASEEIVDKRLLLSGGLNIKKTTLNAQERARLYAGTGGPVRGPGGLDSESQDARLRKEASRRSAVALAWDQQQEAEQAKQQQQTEALETLKRKLEKKTTEEDVGSAKERYLARKRQKALQEKEDEAARAAREPS